MIKTLLRKVILHDQMHNVKSWYSGKNQGHRFSLEKIRVKAMNKLLVGTRRLIGGVTCNNLRTIFPLGNY